MAGPTSISVRHISAAAKASVAKALEQSKTKLPPPTIFGYFPPHWWLGVIVRPELGLTLAEAQKLAGDVHGAIAAEVPAVRGGKPGAIIGDGNLTIGFAPPAEINVLVE